MSIKDWNFNEAGLHRAMGFGAMLIGLPWLLTRRERLQNPPENKKNPVLWVCFPGGDRWYVTEDPNVATAWKNQLLDVKEYWSATRVRDSQNDIHDGAIGFSIAHPFIFGAGLLVGWGWL